MAKSPAFQFYASDFLTDTNSWEVIEVGIYIRLLCTQWVNGSIPNDDERLARIAGVTVAQFKKAWVIVGLKFSPAGNGSLINIKLEDVRIKKKSFLEKQAANGKKGGRPTKEEKLKNEAKENPSLLKNETQNISQKKPLEDEDEEEYIGLKEGGPGETNEGDFFIVREFQSIWLQHHPKYLVVSEYDLEPLRKISDIILQQFGLNPDDTNDLTRERCGVVLETWDKIAKFTASDVHFSSYNLGQVCKYIQAIYQKMSATPTPPSPAASTSKLQHNLSEAEKAKALFNQINATQDEPSH